MSPTVSFPAGRNLADWGAQLASLQPRACWLAYLHLHQVEASVRCLASVPLDPLHRLILSAIKMLPAAAADFWTALDQRLYLGVSALRQLVRQLAAPGLVEEREGGCSITERGRDALAAGVYPGDRLDRRVFSFVERVDAAGNRLQTPHFLPLQGFRGETWPVNGEHYFDPDWLIGCVQSSADWKRDFAFPDDVLGVVDALGPDDWRNIMVDRTERAPIVLVETAEQLLGYAIHVESWRLLMSAPAISLGKNWAAVFPALANDLPGDAYQQAWRSLAKERNLAEADACTVASVDNIARVQAPARLGDSLRRLRTESAKGHLWMLVGDGTLRKIVRVSIEVG